MSIQEKFEKAVNVIRNLPKNGSYQPSHELQLRFYGFYKQATEGFNFHVRPNFWEVVKRAKWDAWAKLGNMTKEEAMVHYVDELRKIVETMSYTDNVASFLNSLDNFYDNVPAEDLEMLVGPIIEKIRSRPNSPLHGSPLASRDTSPSRGKALSRDSSPLRLSPSAGPHSSPKHITSSLETSPASSYSASPPPPETDTDEEEDEHFLDTQTEPDRGKDNAVKKSRLDILATDDVVREQIVQDHLPPLTESARSQDVRSQDDSRLAVTLQVPEPVPSTISVLRQDLDLINNRLNFVENVVKNNQLSKQLPRSGLESCNGSPALANDVTTLGKTPTLNETDDVFRRTIEKMAKDMEALMSRMTVLENKRHREISVIDSKHGMVLHRRWGLPLQTTAILLAWPLVVMLLSKWWSTRRSH